MNRIHELGPVLNTLHLSGLALSKLTAKYGQPVSQPRISQLVRGAAPTREEAEIIARALHLDRRLLFPIERAPENPVGDAFRASLLLLNFTPKTLAAHAQLSEARVIAILDGVGTKPTEDELRSLFEGLRRILLGVDGVLRTMADGDKRELVPWLARVAAVARFVDRVDEIVDQAGKAWESKGGKA